MVPATAGLEQLPPPPGPGPPLLLKTFVVALAHGNAMCARAADTSLELFSFFKRFVSLRVLLAQGPC